MNDDELEKWLASGVPPRAPDSLDEKVLPAAHRILTARRRRRMLRSWLRWGTAAAAMLGVAALAFHLPGRLDRGGDRPAAAPAVFAAAGGGSFRVEGGSRYAHEPSSARLHLDEGIASAFAAAWPLEVTFPGGTLHLGSGEGNVRVTLKGEWNMPAGKTASGKAGEGKALRRRAAAISIALVAGLGWLEIQSDDAAQRRRDLSVGDRLLVEVEADGEGAVRASSVEAVRPGRDGAADAGKGGVDTRPPAPLPGTLRGRVVDGESGEPIQGAKAYWSQGWVSGQEPDGKVQGYALEKPGETVIITSPRQLAEIDPAAILPFRPLAGVGHRAAAETDAAGVFELPPGRPRERLYLLAEGYLPWVPPIPEGWEPAETAGGITPMAGSPAPEDLPEFPLAPERRVRGRLRGADGSVPLPGARAAGRARFALGKSGWSVKMDLCLKEDMTFEGTLGNVDRATLEFEVQGYAKAIREVSLSSRAEELEFLLEPGPRLSGRVIDDAGAPVAGAQVVVRSREKWFLLTSWSVETVLSNAEGRYVANLHGPVVRVEAAKPGHTSAVVEEAPAGTEDLVIVLPRTLMGGIRGRVVDEGGRPMAGIEVVPTSHDQVAQMIATAARTGDRGDFALKLWAGRYTISFQAPADEAGEEKGPGLFRSIARVPVEKAVEVPAGEEGPFLEVVMPAGGTIVGWSLDGAGEPRPGETVHLYRPDLLGGNHESEAIASTDGAGRFEFRGLAPGLYSVFGVEDGKHRFLRISGRETVEVKLGGPMGVLAGKVLRGGRAVPRAALSVGRMGETLDEIQLSRTDEEGSFRLEGMTAGLHILHVKDPASGAALLALWWARLPKDEVVLQWPEAALTVRTGEKPLDEGTRVIVEWVETGGVRLEGLLPPDYRVAGEALPAPAGSFRLEGIGPGKYRVRTEGPGAPRSIEVEVGPEGGEAVLPD